MQKPSLFERAGRLETTSNKENRQTKRFYSRSSINLSDKDSHPLKPEGEFFQQFLKQKAFPNPIEDKNLMQFGAEGGNGPETELEENDIVRHQRSLGNGQIRSQSIKSDLVKKLLTNSSGFDFSAIRFKSPKAKVISKTKIRRLMGVAKMPADSEMYRNLQETPDLYDTNHETYNLWSRILNYDHSNQTDIDEQFNIKRSMLKVKKGLSITHSRFNSKQIYSLAFTDFKGVLYTGSRGRYTGML